MNKIKRVSLLFRLLFQAIFAVLVLVQVVGWIYVPTPLKFRVITIDMIAKGYQAVMPQVLGIETRLLGFMVDSLPTLVELCVLYFLIKLFRLYEQGEIFSLNNVRYARNVGYALLIEQLVNPISQFLLGFVLTWHNPVGKRLALVTISQTNVGIVLTALMVILISWIMAEGYKLQQDQQLTI